MKKDINLTEGALVPTMLRFTLPFLLANILQTLYGIVDTLIIGNFGTTEGLSAVSSSVQILYIFTLFAIGLSSGGTVLVGQCIGGKDLNRARRVVANLIVDFFALSLVLMIVCLSLYPVFLKLINLPEEALPEAYRYMKICSLGVPLIVGYNIACALLRAMGDSKSPLIFVAVASLVNVIGDLFLTGFLGLGALGVAIATVFAQLVSFVFAIVFITKKGLPFSFSLKDIKFDSEITLSIIKVGLPVGIQSIMLNLSFLFITSIINSMGLSASAAMGIGDKIVEFAFMPQSSFMASLSVIVAQNYGAHRLNRAVEAVKKATIICVSIGITFMLICIIFPSAFPSLFTDDPAVIVMAGEYMKAYSIDSVLTSVTFCLAALLNGSGKTTFNMIQNLATTFLCRVPATYFLSKLANTSLFLIGLASPTSSFISMLLLLIYVSTGSWKKQTL